MDTIPEGSPGLKCYSINNSITKCITDGSVPATYKCLEKIANNSRVVCAGASDDCRYSGGSCTDSAGPYT